MQATYINPLTDFGFKKLFGEEPNKDLLISFLNTLLPERHQIAELQYTKNEYQGVSPVDRRAIFDLNCMSSSGERFIVELQKVKQRYFKDRSLYYSTFAIQEQAKQGDWDYKLSTVYTIGILDGSYWIPSSYLNSNSSSPGRAAFPRCLILCRHSKNPGYTGNFS